MSGSCIHYCFLCLNASSHILIHPATRNDAPRRGLVHSSEVRHITPSLLEEIKESLGILDTLGVRRLKPVPSAIVRVLDGCGAHLPAPRRGEEEVRIKRAKERETRLGPARLARLKGLQAGMLARSRVVKVETHLDWSMASM